jgi:4-hydroxybenzoate polyprenyltransferase
VAVALRLALSMFLLQASLGAVNDLVDQPLDREQKPAKPLPSGLISDRLARAWAALTAAIGLALAVPSGPAAIGVAGLGLGLGYAYDLRLSRTALSWLPFAVALPLVPVYGWLGATGSVPPGLGALVPAGLLAGAGLGLGNGLVDIERDAPVGKATIAVRIGRNRAWAAHAGAFAVAIAVAMLFAPDGPGAAGAEILRGVRWAGLPLGAAAIAGGAGLLAQRRASVRERGWELEAIGTAVLGLGWLAGLAITAGGGVGS